MSRLAAGVRRTLLWAIGLPLILLLLLVALGGIAISTETGLSALLGLAGRFAPGTLSYGKIEGPLSGPLHIEQLRYEQGPLKVALQSADLDWTPTALLGRHLNLSRLHFQGLEVHLPPSEATPPTTEPLTLPDIQLPLRVTVADLQGRDIRLIPAAGAPIQIDAIDLQARAAPDGLTIETLRVQAPQGQAQLSGLVNPSGNYPLDLKLNWQAPVAPYGVLHGQGQVQGELANTLRLTHKITGPAELDLDGEVRQALTAAAWSAKTTLNVPDLKLFAPDLPDLAGKPLTAQISAEGVKADFQGQGEINATAPQLGPVTLRFNAKGSPQAITLEQLRLTAPDRALTLTSQGAVQWASGALAGFQSQGELSATVPELGPATLRFNANGDLAAIKLEQLQLTAPDWALTLNSQGEVQLADGALTRFHSQGEMHATAPQLGPLNLRFNADGDTRAITLRELRLTATQRPTALTAQGEVQLADLRFNAAGQWRELIWPLRGNPQVQSARGDFSVEGTPKDYRFTLNAQDLRGPDIPKGNWKIAGQGSDQAVRGVAVNGQTLDGTVQATADVSWQPTLGWRATLSGQGINPGAHWKDVPGKLNFRLNSDGGLANQVLQANVKLEELTGQLSGQRVAGQADVAVRNQDLTIRALQLRAGEARLDASGALTERWDLAWSLNVPQLKSLLPDMSGTVASTGKLSGSRMQPVVAANLTVRDLRHGENRIQQLQGEAGIDTSGTGRSHLNLTGAGLTLGGQQWRNLRLTGAGTPAAHEVKAELNGDPGQFLLALAGALRVPDLLWQGRLTQLNAQNTQVGDWRLEQPATLRASAQEASLESACLSSAPSRVCLQGQWRQSGAYSGRAQLSHLNPERFKRLLPPDVAVTTEVNSEVAVTGQIGGTLQGQGHLNLAPGRVSTKVDGRPVNIAFNGGQLTFNATGQNAAGQARLDLGQTGQAQADIRIQDLFGAGRLNGRLQARIVDLGLVTAFAPQITEITGRLDADVTAGGTLTKPVIRGEARLQNAALTIPEAGLQLREVEFAAVSAGQDVLQLSGSARSDPGRLELSGQLEPFKPHLVLTIVGEDFQAIKTTEMQVQISPDLKIDFTPQATRVDGAVAIPRAFLRPGGGQPGAVNPSGDVVIVKTRDGQTPKAKGGGMAIFADVRVRLGQDVYLETPAFKGKLSGDLQVVETPELAPRGTGAAEVVAGKYKIYGEEIEIQRGQLQFSGSPLDNPVLDLRVVRQERNIISGDEIMAGAQVRGTLQKPKLTFFSTPTMSDPDILAYLVLGRAPGASSSEAAMLFKAASALGSGQNSGITKNLTDAFGLDSAELGSTSQGGTSFMLGKYLTPRLYVGYGIGLINAINTFFIKYRFTKHLMLESATNSIGTGGDFIYTIER